METDANVKNYGMEIIEQGNHVAGFWTGDVHTVYKSSFITLPIAVNYRLANRWKFIWEYSLLTVWTAISQAM